jgi:indole-3-glycerol phosphate synthase
VSRFSEAISEGDGISVIPVLERDVGSLAALAEEAGAEAVAVRAEDVTEARSRTGLPILARDGNPEAVAAAGADAVVVQYRTTSDEGRLEELYGTAYDLGLDFAVDVREEEALEEALERIDPEIVLISERGLDKGDEDLELTLDLLADVPAGKLVVSEARIVSHDQVVALERAGVDAILVQGLARDPDFGAVLEELVHGPEARR